MAERNLTVKIIGDASSLQRSFNTASRSTRQFSSDLGKAERGVLAGSGVFRSLGRSLAFASGGFLAFGGAAAFLRKSIDAAKEAQIANAQLATQLGNSGKSFADYRSQIDKTVFRLSALAGIEDDEVKSGLTTILRTVPDVTKALRDLGTATDLARARHISLAQASIIVAKTEAGNTTLLRRQGFQIAKNATAEQALASVRAVVAGQARAGTTEQERFGAVLHQTEEIIGTGILPTLNKYLISGTAWLEQMNESGKLQKDVSSAAQGFATAIDTVKSAVEGVDKVTGSFKNTLKLLLALKVASTLNGWLGAFSGVGAAAGERGAAGKVGLLTSRLKNLAALGIITVGIEVVLHKKEIDKLGNSIDKVLDDALGHIPGFDRSGAHKALTGSGVFGHKTGGKDLTPDETSKVVAAAKAKAQAIQETILSVFAGETDKPAIAGKGLSASQRNTFFDNAISRILSRGGTGDLQQQLAAINKASALLTQRIGATKDVTRKLNLEDQLIALAAQKKDVTGQIAQGIKDRLTAQREAAAALQEKQIQQLTSKQFRELGLTATGDVPTPQVANLKKRLEQITAGITGTKLDTPKLESQLARFRKVLSEGLVPKDVRGKIKELLDDISGQIKDGTGQLTKFKHTSSDALLSGLGLDGDTLRILRQRLAQVGAGGTVPGSHSPAFGSAGAFIVHTTVNLDGQKVASNTTKHQIRKADRRSASRRGPYAGRH